MGSAPSHPAPVLRGLCPPGGLRVQGQIRGSGEQIQRFAGAIHHAAGPISTATAGGGGPGDAQCRGTGRGEEGAAADKAHVSRLQDAIKYTVNSDLLFRSGSWEMSPQGQEVIAKLAPRLAPFQQSKIVVNGYTDNAPVGRALQRRASPPTRCCRKSERKR